MRSRLRFLNRAILLLGVVNISFILMGGCVNPFVGPSIGEAEVEGRVLYKRKLDDRLVPLPNALITVENSLENTYTDNNGAFKLVIRYRIGNLAKSATVNIVAYHDAASGSKPMKVVIKDGFTSVVPPISLSID